MTVAKVHPLNRRQTMVVVYDIEAAASAVPSTVTSSKPLKRMPHLFAKVLQLPFRSDKDVEVHETPECYMFAIQHSGLAAEDVRVQVLEIVPGAVKVVVGLLSSSSDENQVDCWRFRLPPTTSPEATRVEYSDEVLLVTVPKIEAGGLDRLA
ncbi:17.4 kDa class I heat shock protein [Selaginella moellendorffii]|nr:17.4 kDa class I heat shock protein [Selaginella moellendorffii]|eukprot:XP_002970016.2 17.4 kDa class I heat shock protein [Selaginella moellendorffii]